MKTRQGFVSNSSSSSFLIVGIESSRLIEEIIEKAEISEEIEFGYGISHHTDFNLYGCDSYSEYLGVDVAKRIKDTSFKELSQEFKKMLEEKYGVSVHDSHIDLFFGEVGE